MNKLRMAVLASVAAVGFSGVMMAQDAASSMAADKLFTKQADEGNSAEIAASKMALKKSKNADVKAYAQQMIDDHMKLRSDMKPFADQMSVMTPQPLNSTHKVESQRLAAMTGAKFDKEYLTAMSTDHHKTLGMFDNEIATTSNQDLKTTVTAGRAVVAQHTDMADQMLTKMGVTPPAASR